MENVFARGANLVDEIRWNCKPELLKEIFKLRTEVWKYHQMYVEGGTIGIFDDLQDFKYSSFALLPTAIEIVLAQEKEENFTIALSLLHRCMKESDTTEIPIKLQEQWEGLQAKVNRLGTKDSLLLWKDICKWYRVDQSRMGK